jgi:hypothetical protein
MSDLLSKRTAAYEFITQVSGNFWASLCPAQLLSHAGPYLFMWVIGEVCCREDLYLDAAEAVESRLGLDTPIDPIG